MEKKETTTETKEIKALTLQDYTVTVTMKEGLTAFFTDGKNLDELFAGIEKTARGLVADPLTKEGASQIKGCARQLASLKKRIDDLGKDVVAELKDLPKKIDANRRKFRDSMDGYEDGPTTMRSRAMHDLWQQKLTCPLLTLDGTRPVEELVEAVLQVL